MPSKKDHQHYMSLAIALGAYNLKAKKGGPVGAILVFEGRIIAKSTNESFLKSDPTAHAEMQVIRKAGKKLRTLSLAGSILYTNCQPCPMCLAALYWAEIDTCYYAASTADTQKIGFDDAAMFKEFKKPASERSVTCIQLMQPEAMPALLEWKEVGEARIKQFEKGNRK